MDGKFVRRLCGMAASSMGSLVSVWLSWWWAAFAWLYILGYPHRSGTVCTELGFTVLLRWFCSLKVNTSWKTHPSRYSLQLNRAKNHCMQNARASAQTHGKSHLGAAIRMRWATAGLQNTTAQAHKHVATSQNQIPVPKQKLRFWSVPEYNFWHEDACHQSLTK